MTTTTTTTRSDMSGCSSSEASTIAKNNQFIVQLNLMMSQTTAAASAETTMTTMNGGGGGQQKTDADWFGLLVRVAKHKTAAIMDCLLFALFGKIAELTPRLFGSLLGSARCVTHMHAIVLDKLSSSPRVVSNNDSSVLLGRGQVISSVCEFLCACVSFQPCYFRSLAAVKATAADSGATCVDEDYSVLKALFDLLNELKKHKVLFSFRFCLL